MPSDRDMPPWSAKLDTDRSVGRLTMFVQARTVIEQREGQRRILIFLGDATDRGGIAEMLHGVVEPPFLVEEAQDAADALVRLGGQVYDAFLVEVPRDREVWCGLLRDRALANVPLIAIDADGRPDQRTVRRSLMLKDGAAGYIRAEELTGPLLEATIFGAIERAQMKHAMSEVQERFALAVRGSNDGVWEWIFTSGEMHFSRRWRELLGYGIEDLTNSIGEWFNRVHPEDIDALRADIDAHLAGEKPYHENEHRIRASDGTYRWVISRGVAQQEHGVTVRMAGSLTDTSDFRLREEKIREESRHDPLTSLPRREPFLETLQRSVERARADKTYAFTVLMVDVDRFRWLADSIGHQAADGMLAILALRLTACVRPGDCVCRYGGDKFAILLENLADVALATDIANRIRIAVHEPFDVEGQTVYTTVSIGVTTSKRDYASSDEVINDVAAAANKAKERGQDRHEVFDSKMRIDALTTLRLEVALRQAVERDEFELHYQPIVSLGSGALIGFEALTRWRHPRRGLVSPAEFIPVAEQTGLIVPIGRWAIREAMRQLGRWQTPARPLSMSVNLSGRQIADPRLLEEIETAIANHRVAEGSFRLELTESVLMDNAEPVQRILTALRRYGVRIWVDDFGTGYSSLSYLHRFPVDGIKIDKTFVDALETTEQGIAMVRTILSLAENLNVDVVAEGIERRTQAETLLKLGCLRGQGYLFGRPLTASAVQKLLAPKPPRPLG